MRLINNLKTQQPETAASVPASQPVGETRPAERISYDLNDDKFANAGYQHAIENQACPETFQLMLNHLLRNVEAECYDMRDLNARRRTELEQELVSLQEEREKLVSATIPALQAELKEKKNRYESIQRDPSKLPASEQAFDATKEKLMQAGLICLMLFLYCFYFLTGHAAFIKNIGKALENSQGGEVSTLFETVFDASNVVSDLVATPANLFFCVLFPFIFIVTGYLIHDYLKRNNYWGVAGVMGFTLGLDIAIAYKVTSKMYDAKRLAGLEDQNWHFSMIFSDINFYMVLLAGMAVYVLWGALLGLYMEEKNRGDRVAIFINGCRSEIAALEEEIRLHGDRVAAIETCIRDTKGKIARYDEPGTLALIPWRQTEQILNSFASGWVRGVQKHYQQMHDSIDREKGHRSSEIPVLLDNFKSALRKDLAIAG